MKLKPVFAWSCTVLLVCSASLALAQKSKKPAADAPKRETIAKPMTEKEQKRREAKLKKELEEAGATVEIK